MFKFRRQCGEKMLKEQEIWTFDIDEEKKFKRLLSNPLHKIEEKICGKNRGISCKRHTHLKIMRKKKSNFHEFLHRKQLFIILLDL